MVHYDKDLYDLKVRATGGTSVIHTTRGHLFWNQTTHRWTKAGALKYGTHLRAPTGGSAAVLGGYTPQVTTGWMWDLTIPGNNDHDFYIQTANAAVLVHNDSCSTGSGGDVSPTVGDLRSAGLRDAHHIIQDASVRDVKGYNTNEAPGVQLGGPSTQPGSPHFEATQVQRTAGIGGTYGAERQVASMALTAAGLSSADVASAIGRADAYFMGRLGLTMESPLRIPGNRVMP